MSAALATAYRFTADDEREIREAIRAQRIEWRAAGRPLGRKLDAEEREGLVRIGAWAIGCSIYDLRDVEVEWIRAEVAR
jgi:hypothetical protein